VQKWFVGDVPIYVKIWPNWSNLKTPIFNQYSLVASVQVTRSRLLHERKQNCLLTWQCFTCTNLCVSDISTICIRTVEIWLNQSTKIDRFVLVVWCICGFPCVHVYWLARTAIRFTVAASRNAIVGLFFVFAAFGISLINGDMESYILMANAL